jgi:hypothetical protein
MNEICGLRRRLDLIYERMGVARVAGSVIRIEGGLPDYSDNIPGRPADDNASVAAHSSRSAAEASDHIADSSRREVPRRDLKLLSVVWRWDFRAMAQCLRQLKFNNQAAADRYYHQLHNEALGQSPRPGGQLMTTLRLHHIRLGPPLKLPIRSQIVPSARCVAT